MEDDPRSGVGRWLLLRANRWILTAIVLVMVFLVIVGVGMHDVDRLRAIINVNGGLQFLFSAFIGAIITGTSIVVTLNQLVLAQELGAVRSQRQRMEGATAFRRSVEGRLGLSVAPIEPGEFLASLTEEAAECGRTLQSMADDLPPNTKEAIGAYGERLEAEATYLAAGIGDAEFGTFEVMWYALRFDYSRLIHDARTLRAEQAETIPTNVDHTLDHTLGVLRCFAPAREHFKTLYFQWALIDLSRALLYVSIPALTTMGILTLYADETTISGSIMGVDLLVIVVGGGFAIGIAPFVIFTVFILRIATVAKQTLAMGPFVLQDRRE